MMHKELIANLKDWASDADAHGKQMVPVHRDTLRRIAAALAAPAQEQAGAPAQEQSVEDEAQALIDAGHAFWNSCKSLGGGAVRWLQCEDGTLIIFTRGEYRERLMSRICADYSAPQYVYQSGEWQALSAEPKQQAGAAEVSDEQIEKLAHRMCWQYWHSSDPHLSSTYKFNRTTLLKFVRAALALKAGGVA